MWINYELIEAQAAHYMNLHREITKDDAGRRFDVFHASSTGHCIRKVVVNYLNGLSLAGKDAYDFDACPYPDFERARIEKTEDAEFQGIMHIGKIIHERLQKEWDERGLVIAGDAVSNEENIEKYLSTCTTIGQENDRLFDVFGMIDCLIKVHDESDTEQKRVTLVDIKSVGEARWKILEKSMVTHEFPNFKLRVVADPGIKECSQAMCYRCGLPVDADNLDMHENPFICYYNKSTAQIAWAEVERDRFLPFMYSYWLKIWEALDDHKEMEVLPLPSPVEKWECMWGRGKKFCEYHKLCFPGKYIE